MRNHPPRADSARGRRRRPATDRRVEDLRIAILDDQPPNVRLLARFLERAGFHRLDSFTDPREAVEAFGRELPDLVLLDLHMPGLDGFEVLGRIAALVAPGDFLPILVLTGDVDRAVRQRALQAGAKDFLLKPFDPDEVVVRCRNLLETRRLHLELRRRNEELAGEVVERTSALEEALRERLAVASALASPRAKDDLEAVATTLCEELVGLSGIDGAALVSFDDANVTPLAVSGRVGRAFELGRHVPPELARRLIERTSTGPWVEEGGAADVSIDEPSVAGRLWTPMHAGSDVVGALMAASSQPLVGDRLVRMMPTILEYAAVAGATLAPAIVERYETDLVRRDLVDVIERRAFTPVFQPIVDLATGATVGFEALTRFSDGMRPDRRFAEAALVGIGADLELACLGAALEAADRLPHDRWLSFNVSPAVVIESPQLAEIMARAAQPLVVELTEHVPVEDYGLLRDGLRSLGAEIRFAIDDTGAGFANFRHIVELDPDFVKLDIGLVRAIDSDPARQAFVSGMDYFAARTGCALIAEGIETVGERDMLESLAVPFGQGFLLGRPAPIH
jgi:EAL domain-containing protein (putative c-di-GMP-specific phosphodiesterase class I)/DNA-binding NarL/FixJ family response regulator